MLKLFALLAAAVAAASASSLTVAWTFDTYVPIYSSPILHNGLVIFGSTDTNLYALTQATGTVAWKFPTGNRILGTPCVSELYNIVYFGSTDRHFYALNASTGAQIWKSSKDSGSTRYKRCVTSNSKVFYSIKSNFMVVRDLLTGSQIYTQVGHSSPVLSDDCNSVFVGCYDGYVRAYHADSGTPKWVYDSSTADTFGDPAYRYGQLYVGSKDTCIRAINVETGAKVWRESSVIGSTRWSYPDADVGMVVSGTTGGYINGINEATGKLKWNQLYSTEFRSGVVSSGGTLYVGDNNGVFHILRTSSGEKLERFTANSKFTKGSRPAVADGFVYFGTSNGTLYAMSYPPAVRKRQPVCPGGGPTNPPPTWAPPHTWAPATPYPIAPPPPPSNAIVITTCLNQSCTDCRPRVHQPGCVAGTNPDSTTSLLRQCITDSSGTRVMRVSTFPASGACNPFSNGVTTKSYALLTCYDELEGSFVVTSCGSGI